MRNKSRFFLAGLLSFLTMSSAIATDTTAATTGTTTANTQPPAPASTNVSTTVPQGGALPPQPGPERIVHNGRVTSSFELPVSERQKLIANLRYL